MTSGFAAAGKGTGKLELAVPRMSPCAVHRWSAATAEGFWEGFWCQSWANVLQSPLAKLAGVKSQLCSFTRRLIWMNGKHGRSPLDVPGSAPLAGLGLQLCPSQRECDGKCFSLVKSDLFFCYFLIIIFGSCAANGVAQAERPLRAGGTHLKAEMVFQQQSN